MYIGNHDCLRRISQRAFTLKLLDAALLFLVGLFGNMSNHEGGSFIGEAQSRGARMRSVINLSFPNIAAPGGGTGGKDPPTL